MDWRRRASDDVNKPRAPLGQESDTELAGAKKKRKSPFRRLVRGNIQDEIHGERVREGGWRHTRTKSKNYLAGISGSAGETARARAGSRRRRSRCVR
jgi:histone H3/H4